MCHRVYLVEQLGGHLDVLTRREFLQRVKAAGGWPEWQGRKGVPTTTPE